jgi:carbon storage regulator
MLILTRRPNESIVISNNIEIKVLEVLGNQVSLGFVAPREISIYRKEVFEAIQKENIQAAARGEPAVRKLKETLGSRAPG